MATTRPDVLMVTPPSRVEVYQKLSVDYAAIEPPVWSGLIADFIRRRGHDVAMFDAEAEGLTCDDTARRIAEIDPTLIVYMIYGQQPSASTQCMPAGREVASRVKALSDRPSLELRIEQALSAWTADDAIARLHAADVPVGSVNGLADVVTHPQLVERGRWVEQDSEVGPVRVVTHPFDIEGLPRRRGRVPTLGEHTDNVVRADD